MIKIFPYSFDKVLSAQRSELIWSLLAGSAATRGLPTSEALLKLASCQGSRSPPRPTAFLPEASGDWGRGYRHCQQNQE